MENEKKEPVKPNSFCGNCRSKLIHKSKFKPSDPWMALEIAALLICVNAALKDNRFLIKYGNDVYGINRISCLGCFLPAKIDHIIKVASTTKDIGKIKDQCDI